MVGTVPTRSLTDTELDALADGGHLQYEVTMLVGQACRFHRTYPAGMPPQDGFEDGVGDDALLEAILIHLRLLDDFLASRGTHRCDLLASDWIAPQLWTPTRDWLAPRVRKHINWQVAHLSLCREPWFDWQIRANTYSCCQQLSSFVRAVEVHRRDRFDAFAVIDGSIQDGLVCLAPS